MAIPSSYTEPELAAFMQSCLGDMADILGWTDTTADGDYQRAVDNALVAYGVSDIAKATDIAKLRALARREVWSTVVEATSGQVDFSADGAKFSQGDLQSQAMQSFRLAITDALPYDSRYTVTAGTFTTDAPDVSEDS